MFKILIIEDHKEVRENIAELLVLANYLVITAENGKKGVEMAKKELPDLIVCDVMMPELDGYGVLKLLSSDTKTAAIPFIFLTAKSEVDDFKKGLRAGADDYITKPFTDVDLMSAIELRLRKLSITKKQFENSIEGLNEFVQYAKDIVGISEVIESKKSLPLKRKQLLYQEGSRPMQVFYIAKGRVKTFLTNEDGKELITGLYHQGDYIGYVDLIEDTEYKDSAELLEDCEIVTIGKKEFTDLLFKNPEVSQTFIKLLSQNLKDKEDRLINLAYNSVRKRVANALLMLFDNFSKANPSSALMPMSRDDLSELVGASKETVIRTLTDFKDEHLVEVEGTKIKFLNIEKLRKLKN
jgi:CheY-like chemotaxis protein/CRP-like cAMP-binding protein